MSFVTDFIGDLTGANKAADAADDASRTQAAAAQAGIEEQRRQFDAVQQLLNPFVTAGNSALTGQMDLLGRNGDDAQLKAIQALQASPQFTSMLRQGESSILANASATGGLRGGNTQAALMQFSPSLLAATINDQFGRLGQLSSLGQSSAAGVGNAGLQTGNAIAGLLQQQGAARAGGQIAAGNANRMAFGDLMKIGSVASGFF